MKAIRAYTESKTTDSPKTEFSFWKKQWVKIENLIRRWAFDEDDFKIISQAIEKLKDFSFKNYDYTNIDENFQSICKNYINLSLRFNQKVDNYLKYFDPASSFYKRIQALYLFRFFEWNKSDLYQVFEPLCKLLYEIVNNYSENIPEAYSIYKEYIDIIFTWVYVTAPSQASFFKNNFNKSFSNLLKVEEFQVDWYLNTDTSRFNIEWCPINTIEYWNIYEDILIQEEKERNEFQAAIKAEWENEQDAKREFEAIARAEWESEQDAKREFEAIARAEWESEQNAKREFEAIARAEWENEQDAKREFEAIARAKWESEQDAKRESFVKEESQSYKELLEEELIQNKELEEISKNEDELNKWYKELLEWEKKLVKEYKELTKAYEELLNEYKKLKEKKDLTNNSKIDYQAKYLARCDELDQAKNFIDKLLIERESLENDYKKVISIINKNKEILNNNWVDIPKFILDNLDLSERRNYYQIGIVWWSADANKDYIKWTKKHWKICGISIEQLELAWDFNEQHKKEFEKKIKDWLELWKKDFIIFLQSDHETALINELEEMFPSQVTIIWRNWNWISEITKAFDRQKFHRWKFEEWFLIALKKFETKLNNDNSN